MSEIKYLLDEHVDPRLRQTLKLGWPELTVWRIGAPDPEILDWCAENGFVLVTNNRASMPVHLRDHLAAERPAVSIFVLQPKMTLREISEELALIGAAAEIEEYLGVIEYLPLSY